jgi:hypothetical protein
MSTVTVRRADATTRRGQLGPEQGPRGPDTTCAGMKTPLLISRQSRTPGWPDSILAGTGSNRVWPGTGQVVCRNRGIPLLVAARPCPTVPI